MYLETLYAIWLFWVWGGICGYPLVKFQESNTRDQPFAFLFKTVVRSPLNKTRWIHFELTTFGRHSTVMHPPIKRRLNITFLSMRYSESGRSRILRHTDPWCSYPIGSMYDIFAYMWLIFMVNVDNVGKCTIHGSLSGIGCDCGFILRICRLLDDCQSETIFSGCSRRTIWHLSGSETEPPFFRFL